MSHLQLFAATLVTISLSSLSSAGEIVYTLTADLEKRGSGADFLGLDGGIITVTVTHDLGAPPANVWTFDTQAIATYHATDVSVSVVSPGTDFEVQGVIFGLTRATNYFDDSPSGDSLAFLSGQTFPISNDSTFYLTGFASVVFSDAPFFLGDDIPALPAFSPSDVGLMSGEIYITSDATGMHLVEIIDLANISISNTVNINIAESFFQFADAVEDMELAEGIGVALRKKVANAFDAWGAEVAEQRQDAINKLESIVNFVEAQRGKGIPDADADYLIIQANQIIADINRL